MKVRVCFVSNCSSEAFIVSHHDYASTILLATEMIIAREFNNEEDTVDQDLIDRMNTLSKNNNVGESPNITFPTCNYDTYIANIASEGIYLVSTSNNHSWLSIRHESIGFINIEGMNCYDDVESLLQEKFWFWDIESDLRIKHLSTSGDLCNKHYNYPCYINGSNNIIACPGCYLEKNLDKSLTNAEISKRVSNSSRIFNLRVDNRP